MKYLYNIIKIGLVLILGLFITAMLHYNAYSAKPIGEVKQNILQAADLSAMQEADARTLKKLYGLDKGSYEEFVLYTSADSMDVKEILLVKTENDSQADAVEQAITKRIEAQKQNFDGYGLEQMKQIGDAETLVKGNYVFFAISPGAETMKKAFLDSLISDNSKKE
ncbi:DUF4358 domain-containing protein [Diplocloster agilis]|uniref:DUF4358 domain-containing protein n=1 Tax=Diplocloster agilis TaxID=2850323 RepID=A0A949K1G3_9FIRM|nr:MULTISPECIES: DUF4358 domain-containing protein [Lachnospiraceae]MBU9738449.1 DUF4358 domain-containing protein [Diplocloster agilis]MBU9745060.1 DUF4358 domain-containing protein [Diplocloster agilis]MCU6735394.1 DUF4358 domain-containing protein [Suonthocola fibrivorans]SCJ72549.1 Uncharacterised protein [uncultured Clostridium sp.]